ncbi:MAG: hypothetical protein WAT79_14505 [Saprospiraceae bacterium]
MLSKAYPSKILLFGEYTVTLGSPALAIPFFNQSGRWILLENHQSDELMAFYRFLRNENTINFLDLSAFEKDIQQGLLFESNIPQGYGQGSSGALVAAVYDTYKTDSINDLEILCFRLSSMESFYHGSSSGIDPLVSYTKEPILINKDKSIEICHYPTQCPYSFFLLDTHISRKTQKMVQIFQQKMKEHVDFKMVVDRLSQLNQNIIQAFINGEYELMWTLGQKISQVQWTHFNEFIPSNQLEIWKDSCVSEVFFLKLCGAGGGGYNLGCTLDVNAVFHKFQKHSPIWLTL